MEKVVSKVVDLSLRPHELLFVVGGTLLLLSRMEKGLDEMEESTRSLGMNALRKMTSCVVDDDEISDMLAAAMDRGSEMMGLEVHECEVVDELETAAPTYSM